MGSKLGVIKAAAGRLNLTVEEYTAKRAAGLKWCSGCREWLPTAKFTTDRSRGDGLSNWCNYCRLRGPDPKKPKPARVSPFKGKKHTRETVARMSAAAKKRGGVNRLGKKHSPESRRLISQQTRKLTPCGAACHSFIDGKAAERRGERHSAEYKRWRFDVYSRDRFACVMCGDDRGSNLNAHHIYPFAKYPELRLNLDNGITLCERCHDRHHYGKTRKGRGGKSRSGKHTTPSIG